jgi:hypothetical protein
MEWPEKDIPREYLVLAQELVQRPTVSERDFIDLCKMAIKYIQSGDIPINTRSDMALYIANLWVKHKNIGDVSLLSDIGGQFGEWEIPGSFIIDHEPFKQHWDLIVRLVDKADKLYPPEK